MSPMTLALLLAAVTATVVGTAALRTHTRTRHRQNAILPGPECCLTKADLDRSAIYGIAYESVCSPKGIGVHGP